MDPEGARVATAPLLVAHRTCPHHAPENSLEGIARAAELGADAVEIDVRLTRDGFPILMHDRTLRRTAGNRAPVWARSQKEVLGLRLTNEEPVPTFAAALDALPDGLQLAVHVKVPRAIHPVLDEIRNQGAQSRVWIWSQQPSVVRFSADRHPELETALLKPAWTRQGRRAALRDAERSGARAVGTFWGAVAPDFAAALRERGLRFAAWCRTRDIDPAKAGLLDVLVSDWPADARATMRRTTATGETT
jgi:glycerophosphoryl diester phosphodiesterase